MNTIINPSRAVLALAAVAAAGAIVAPSASAAYGGTTAACAGATINGGGASLQKTAQTRWGADQLTGWVSGTPLSSLATSSTATSGFGFAGAPGAGCAGFRTAGKTVRYASIGSGAGRNLWGANGGARDASADFVATDEPLNNIGEEAATETSGSQVETIPVAQAAVAVIVKLPAGCTLAAATNRTATLTNLEKLYWGTTSTWGQLLGASALTPAACNSQAVTKTARFDSSGTSFAFKKVLNSNNGHWAAPTDYTSAANNTVWPSAVTKPATSGGGAVASLVNATAGSIGYVDLATARAANFGFTGVADQTFWLRINAASGGGGSVTNDPAKDAAQAPVTPGANCGTAREYANTPASTKNNWFAVTGAKATYAAGEYPICTLTYAQGWDTSSLVAGFTEPRARSVYDYLNWAVSTTGGQTLLAAGDYQALPTTASVGTPLQTIAAAGADDVDWS